MDHDCGDTKISLILILRLVGENALKAEASHLQSSSIIFLIIKTTVASLREARFFCLFVCLFCFVFCFFPCPLSEVCCLCNKRSAKLNSGPHCSQARAWSHY